MGAYVLDLPAHKREVQVPDDSNGLDARSFVESLSSEMLSSDYLPWVSRRLRIVVFTIIRRIQNSKHEVNPCINTEKSSNNFCLWISSSLNLGVPHARGFGSSVWFGCQWIVFHSGQSSEVNFLWVGRSGEWVPSNYQWANRTRNVILRGSSRLHLAGSNYKIAIIEKFIIITEKHLQDKEINLRMLWIGGNRVTSVRPTSSMANKPRYIKGLRSKP